MTHMTHVILYMCYDVFDNSIYLFFVEVRIDIPSKLSRGLLGYENLVRMSGTNEFVPFEIQIPYTRADLGRSASQYVLFWKMRKQSAMCEDLFRDSRYL